jgi:hypothetical protein
MNQFRRENPFFCATPFHAESAIKRTFSTNGRWQKTAIRWLFFFLLWAIRVATSGQAAGRPALICLLVKLDTTQAAFTVIGLMEDITALLSD